MAMRGFWDGARRDRRGKRRTGIAMCGILLLSACATERLPGAVEPWSTRVTALRAVDTYTLTGRLAVVHGGDGFSAGVHWAQHGADAGIDLSAPLGFGAAHIEQRGGALNVTTSHGEVLASEAAQQELRATLGFDPPLASLRYWLLGASDPASPAQESLDAQQRLTALMQDGWEIDYADYVWTQRQWLPRRLTVARDDLRLRLVINDWRL